VVHRTLDESQELERQYVAHRSSVMAMLRSEFGGLPDHEELYQEAWTEALELRARGKEIANVGGLLRTIAWRRARDQLRKSKPTTLDPSSAVFEVQSDPSPTPDVQAQVRLDAAVIREVVDSLDERQAAVIKLRFDDQLSSREIQEQLGVSPKRLEKIVTEAYGKVESALTPTTDGMSPWHLRQRSLLLACETGIASRRQRARAQRMLAHDPTCRAMLREMRSTLRDLAAAVPLPLVIGGTEEKTSRVRGAFAGRWGDLRDQLADLVGRLSGHAPAMEQAGSGTVAGLGLGMAAKAAIVCVLAAGGTAVCIVATDNEPKPKPTHEAVRTTSTTKSTRTTVSMIDPISPPIATKTTKPKSSKPKAAAKRKKDTQPAVSASQATSAPASPAPTDSTEFGPGDVGSSSAAAEPAAAPSDGGSEFAP
jgi:RNA polymerase sigma factor (sigma-70 family)